MDEESLIKILVAAPNPGETLEQAMARKERILGSMFGSLSPVESRGMWMRISRERTGDPLSETIARFPTAMRERLMSMLLDPRRLK